MLKKIEKNNPDLDWIDNFFDEVDDPIIDSCTMIGYIESLILNSLYDLRIQKELMQELEELRESKINEFIHKLKLNQNIRDPKDQFKAMAKAGVFTSFMDQN